MEDLGFLPIYAKKIWGFLPFLTKKIWGFSVFLLTQVGLRRIINTPSKGAIRKDEDGVISSCPMASIRNSTHQ